MLFPTLSTTDLWGASLGTKTASYIKQNILLLNVLSQNATCPYFLEVFPPSCILSFSLSLNYCRGKGPLKNSSDVINAAKKIAEAGSRMDKLSRAVADQVAL